MKKVIIINGAGIGKYKFLEKLKETEDFNVFSSVSKVKEICKMFGWDGKSLTEKDRSLISNIKDAYTTYSNGPALDLIKDIEQSDKELNIVLSREKNDNDQLRKHFGNNIKVILFSRVGARKNHDNHADQGIYQYDYDKVMLVFENSIDSNIEEFKEFIYNLKNE